MACCIERTYYIDLLNSPSFHLYAQLAWYSVI